MSKLLSVIVPVYNVSKYIHKCVDSILVQSYSNLEIILVDDGSPDECPKICDEYASKDKRVQVIHKTNGGLSSARNAGLEIAVGEYIGFVDSDDWIEPSMYEKMITFIEQNECDMAGCEVNIIYGTHSNIIGKSEDEILTGKEALIRYLDTYYRYRMPNPAVWSKLYKKEFWKENRFPEGKIHEDYLLTCMAFNEASKVAFIHEGLYNHLADNPDSICNTKFSKRDLYKRTQCEYIVDYLTKTGDEELISRAKEFYYFYLVGAIWKCDQNGMTEDTCR